MGVEDVAEEEVKPEEEGKPEEEVTKSKAKLIP